TLQHQAIAERRDQLRAEGWAKVEVLEIGDYFRSWEYQRTAKDAGGWVLILPQENGAVLVHAGYLPLQEARRLARQAAGGEAETAAANDAPKAVRSETTQALQNYVALHKAAAVRYALVQNPAVALRLAVAGLIGNASHWSVRADRTPPHGPAVAASVATGTARAAFAEARRAVTGEPDATDATLLGHGHGERQTVEAFARLLELSDEPVLKALAVATAETLVAGSGLAERLGEWLQIDMRRFWKPDETFLDLLTDKAALGRSAAEVGATPSAKATGKELRGLIRRRLKGEGCQPVANWLPRYCEFPSRGYTSRPASEARAAYDRLARGWAEEPTGGEADAEPDAGAPGWVEDRADAALDEAA
ncbi:MAG TPA: hypothetical protein P5284_10975, partial [Candidatus Contendobacter sp.]|nr:hypothetical protein [Candidatus Contendobacter sp.]